MLRKEGEKGEYFGEKWETEILSLSGINSQLWNQGTGESYLLVITSFLYVMAQYLIIPSMRGKENFYF